MIKWTDDTPEVPEPRPRVPRAPRAPGRVSRVSVMWGLCALLAALGLLLATARQAAAVDTPTTASLTPAQRDTVRTALADRGITGAAAERVLSSPDAAAVPVTVTYATSTVTPALRTRLPSRSYGSCTSVWSKTKRQTVYYANVFGKIQGNYTVYVTWCYNFSRVTYVHPSEEGGVATWAAILGWEYDGTVGVSDSWLPWTGRYHGQFKVWRQGHLHVCLVHVPVACINYYPRIHLYPRLDGSIYTWKDG